MNWGLAKLEKARLHDVGKYSSKPGEPFGAFKIRGPLLDILCIIANDVSDDSAGWQHVSVSLPNRTPTWAEMAFVKDLFWDAEETVVQFHPPQSAYVNFHPHCLHLWRHPEKPFDLPPMLLVGPPTGAFRSFGENDLCA